VDLLDGMACIGKVSKVKVSEILRDQSEGLASE
jgi:hypothetical protein